MTIYAYDPDRAAVVATWPIGVGSVAKTVCQLPESLDGSDAFDLVRAMTELAKTLWQFYAEPTVAEIDDEQELLARKSEEEAARKIETFLRSPNLPQGGLLIESYVAVEEHANRVGRRLHAISDAAVTDAVVVDFLDEADAVVRAEHGDLSGRAAQAIAIGRTEANPLQVGTAFALLSENPFGSRQLLEEVEPSAACIAAAYWLAAAATVATNYPPNDDYDPCEVFNLADDLQAVSIDNPRSVVEAILEEELAPREAVQDLFDSGEEPRELLLELLDGVNSAALIFSEVIDVDDVGVPRIAGEALVHPEAKQWQPRATEDDERDWQAIHAAGYAKFVELVRLEANKGERPS